MKNEFAVECWLFNKPVTARIFVKDFLVYREYHPVIVSNSFEVSLDDYYFISLYDGTLQLNQPPADEFSSILLKELADAIECRLKDVQRTQIFTYTSRLTGGSPSAAA
ncbi:MAG TPA: hypothetical protein VLC28_13890 [Flavitalea sp.]|nr:hypothetical protein [Flavitalea sp.]